MQIDWAGPGELLVQVVHAVAIRIRVGGGGEILPMLDFPPVTQPILIRVKGEVHDDGEMVRRLCGLAVDERLQRNDALADQCMVQPTIRVG